MGLSSLMKDVISIPVDMGTPGKTAPNNGKPVFYLSLTDKTNCPRALAGGRAVATMQWLSGEWTISSDQKEVAYGGQSPALRPGTGHRPPLNTIMSPDGILIAEDVW